MNITKTGIYTYQGIEINIEHLAGSVRPWKDVGMLMQGVHYGMIPRTKATDGEEIDILLAESAIPNPKPSDAIFIFHKAKFNDDSIYDEDKLFIGFPNYYDALTTFRTLYQKPETYEPDVTLTNSEILQQVLSASNGEPGKLSPENISLWCIKYAIRQHNDRFPQKAILIEPAAPNDDIYEEFASLSSDTLEADASHIHIPETDIRIDTYRNGSSVAEQNLAVRLTHIPTGIVVESKTERSAYRNRKLAMEILQTRLAELQATIQCNVDFVKKK